MPKHRGLNLAKFLKALDYALLDQYFVALVSEDNLPQRIWMNDELLKQFLEDPKNALTRGIVLEHFQRINDLARAGKSTLVWIYNRSSLSWSEDETPANMAMRLYLEHSDKFKFAYALYQWYNCPSRMSEFRMPIQEFALTEERLATFKQEVTAWFAGLAKGDTTDIKFYDQDGTTVILVTHGTYIHTVAEWQGDQVEIRSFRPATEDILMYNPEQGLLRIKATLEKDRKQYVQSFASHILEDISVVEEAEGQPAYTLEPFQTGEFDFAGNEAVRKVILLEAKLQLPSETEPRLHVKSKDVRRTLGSELEGINLRMGELKYVKLRFQLRIDGEDTQETVEICPPERSDLPGAKHEEVIASYLREQGVKLI